MYLVGKGHTHYGPGTSFVQRIDWTRPEEMQLEGMGCAGMGCGCGGSCKRGLGLFDSMDFTTWGPAEFAVIGVGAYLILSLAGDTRRAATSVRKSVRRRRRAAVAG